MSEEPTWQRKDVGLGLLFVFVGVLVSTLSWFAWVKEEFPFASLVRFTGPLCGVVLLSLGVNAVVRSLLARDPDGQE